MSEYVVLPDHQAVAQAAAERWQSIAAAAVEARGRFSVALAGGSTPEPLYHLLAHDSWFNRLPWANTHVFWGDERRVPQDHDDSNFKMAYDALLSKVPIPPAQIYPMDGTGLTRSTMRAYESALKTHFQPARRELPRFDLVLLGMGTDGHTASIFPGTRAVSDRSHWVLVYEVPQLDSERMTLTLPILNNARHILVMVVGERKADTLHAVIKGPRRTSTYPIQAVEPRDGQLTWLLDESAARRLSL